MEEIGLIHRPKHKPSGITQAHREARESDDLLKRDFTSTEPLKKCVTDITEIKAKDGRIYVSAIFDCFDAAVLGLAMDTNMKASLCQRTLDNAICSYPALRGAVIHSDRGAQYTSETYRRAVTKHGIFQSMNSAGGRCHDNARCESMWARMKEELIYGRHNPEEITVEELKSSSGDTSSAIGTTGGYALLMRDFPLWSNSRDIMDIWGLQLRHSHPCKKVSTNIDNIRMWRLLKSRCSLWG